MSALFFNILIMIFIPSVALCTFGFFSNKISTTTQKKKKKKRQPQQQHQQRQSHYLTFRKIN